MTLYPVNEKNRQIPNKVNFTTWDIETDYPDNPKNVSMIGFYNSNIYKSWKNENNDNDSIFEKFLGEVLKSKYYGYSHYAHFGGKFDFIYMLDTLKKYDYDFDIIDVNGRILSIEVLVNKEKGKYFKFNDSYALLPKSLKDITHSFSNQLTYIKLEHDFDSKDKDIFCCLEHQKLNCFDCYMKSDVISLYQSLKVFENIINQYNGEMKLTIASTSLDIFKHQYLKIILNSLHDIKIGNIKGKEIILNIEDIIRNYYFGGRCEIFKRYIEYGFYYDINSLYPFVMLQPMPISQPIFCLPENINFNKDSGFIYCSSIEFWNKDKIPLIPYKLKLRYSKKLIYPMGKWSGWIDLDMYRKAIQIGYKFNIEYGIIFNTDNIFKDFVMDFYKLRFTNDTMKLIAKLIMNSLYGKFAQKRLKKQIIKYLGIDENILKELIPYNLDENLYQKETLSKSKHIIPSISAHITTLAQLELYKYFEKCNNDIYYCDTDSFITQKQLSHSKNLGDIKLEYEIDKAVFLLPKTYYLEGFDLNENKYINKITMKGFVKNKFEFTDFYNAMITNNYDKFNYKIKKLWGFKESIKRNKIFCTYDEKINSLKTGYDKRIILDDRINTKPLIINEGILINE